MDQYRCAKCGKKIPELDYDPEMNWCYDCMADDIVDTYSFCQEGD